MKKSDKGFILPLAIILSLLFSGVVLHFITLLESDRLFIQERKNYFQHQLLLQSAANEILVQLENLDKIETSGQFIFHHGTVTYNMTQIDEFTATFEYISKTEFSGQRKVTVVYDLTSKVIKTWTE